jgi:chitodextrinase
MDLFEDEMLNPRTGAIGAQDSTQPRNLHNPGRTFSEAILVWDTPLDSSGFIGYDILCAGRETVRTLEHVHVARNLTPETPYLFEIQPRRTPDKPLALSQSITVITHDRNPPTKPKALRVTEITSNSATLYWGASESRTGEIRYRIYVNGVIVAETDQLQFTVLHLRNFTYFKVKVRAVLTSGLAPASVPASIKFRTLLRPPILSFRQRNGIGKLSWAPNYWALPAHEGTVNGHGFTRDILALSYKFRVAERSSGPPYRFDFQVRARADGVYSEFSKLQATVDEIIPPSQPGTPTVNAIGDTSVTLSWAPSADNKAVTGYRLIRWGGGELWDSTVVTDARCTYTDLNSGSRYLFVVRAQDAAGNESIPSEVMFKTTGSSFPEPLAPRVTYTPLTSTSVLLEWTFEAEGIAAAGARITINGDYHSDVFVPNQSLLLEGLVVESEYTITVIAYTTLAMRISDAATSIYVPKDRTPPSVPPLLTITDDIVYSEAATSTNAPKAPTPTSESGDLRVSENGLYSVTLEWEPSTDDIGMHGYVIYNNHEYCDDTPFTQYTATHLYAGQHLFHVRALDIHGNTSEPAVALVEVPGEKKPFPSRPGRPLVSELTATSAKLTWAPSVDGKGGAITYHVMRLGFNTLANDSTPSTEIAYAGLPPGSRHFFTVRAMDEAGKLSSPSQVFFQLEGDSPVLPPVSKLTIEPETSTSATLRWSYSGENSGQGVRIVINGQWAHDVSRRLSWKLENLIPGAEYSISMLAYATLPARLSGPVSLVYRPEAVASTSVSAGLHVTATTSDSVTLAWDGVASDSDPHGYLIYNHHKHVGSTLGTRYSVVGLSPGSHSFSLRSVDLEGSITELGTVDVQLTG